MKKISLWIIFIILLVVSCFVIQNTYALFENNSNGNVNVDIGKWVIHINDNDITEGTTETLNLNNFIYTDNENIEDGYIAPGRSGYVNIIIDPAGTDVAIRYDLTFDTNSNDYADNIKLSVQQDGGSTIRTGVNTYSGIIDLANIEKDKVTLRVDVEWDDDGLHDDSDTLLGEKEGESISIPVDVNISQYLGESLEEYVDSESGNTD